MVINVPQENYSVSAPDMDKVRIAAFEDVPKMNDLEMEISAIKQQNDYRYAIENPREVVQATMYENNQQRIHGFMIAAKHCDNNFLGPSVARTEEMTFASICRESERFRSVSPLFFIPMLKSLMVERLYEWSAFNVETNLKEVWGEFQDYRGVSVPSYLPKTE
jgi:hypothetical protein